MNPRRTAQILVLDSHRPRVDALANRFQRLGRAAQFRQLPIASALPHSLEAQEWDLVLVHVEDFAPLAPLAEAIARHPLPRPRLLAYGPPCDDATLLQQLEAGAHDYLSLAHPDSFAKRLYQHLQDAERLRRLHRCERALRECGDLFLTLFEPHPQPMAYLHEGMHILANRRYRTLFGHDRPGSLETIPLLDLAAPGHRDRLRSLLRQAAEGRPINGVPLDWCRHDGRCFQASVHLRRSHINGEPALQLVLQPEAEARAQVIPLGSQRDAPRGPLMDGERFLQRLDAHLKRRASGALLFLEADDFTQIKDNIGVLASEQVLRQLTDLLQRQLPPEAALARLGGGVFAILLDEDEAQAQARAEALRQAVEAAIFDAQEQSVTLTVSIGLAPIPPGIRKDTLLAQADLALTIARSEGGDRVHCHREPPSQRPDPNLEARWVPRLRQALARDAFTLVYMPIAALRGQPGSRYEALLRLADEDGQPIPPDRFVYAAQQAGLAPQLDRWVIQRAWRHLSRADAPEQLFVKLSAPSFRDPDFCRWLYRRLEEDPERARRLVLELNEADASSYLKDAKDFTAQVQRRGGRCALEHFSGQHEALRHLRHLRLHYLKLDASLVHPHPEDPDAETRLRQALEMAERLGLQTIAECVERSEDLERLWRLGIHHIQGYYLRPPAPELDYDFGARL